jgi:hypothetical protein
MAHSENKRRGVVAVRICMNGFASGASVTTLFDAILKDRTTRPSKGDQGDEDRRRRLRRMRAGRTDRESDRRRGARRVRKADDRIEREILGSFCERSDDAE